MFSFFSKLKNKLVQLKEMVLSVSHSLELFYRQVVAQRGLPFELQVPNEKTMKAIRSSRSGKGRSFSTAEELFKEELL
jgi:DNA-damage-inducible protein J